MFPVENIKAVCKERGTTIAQVERALGMGNGVIARWATMRGTPALDRVQAVADHLGVPVSRITGEDPSDTTSLSPEFAAIYSRLSAQGRADLDKYARFLLSQEGGK